MSRIHEGRWTAQLDQQGCVVFLIGMRFNRPWRVDKWGLVAVAMPKMLGYLRTRPDSGYLAGKLWYGRTIVLISYWRSQEDLLAFASAADAPHREAWKKFNRAVGKDGSVGIWHETYLVEPGKAEAVYANMPRFGLAAATSHVPVTAATTTAHKRLRVTPE